MIRMVFLGLHILSASVIFGTGVGIAFFMVRAKQTGDAATVAVVSKMVVTANFVFTAIAFVVVALCFLGLFLEGWRALLIGARRLAARSSSN